MVLTTSWRCLRNSSLRSAVTPAITPAAVSYFSTSPAFAAAATKSKPLSKPPRKGGYALGINKKTTKDTHTKAAYKHGERKEIRNRIILSNTNAPVLPTPEMTVEVSLHEPAVGTLFSFSNSDIDGLRAVGAFQRGQNWKFFQRPSTVMRHETLVMGEMLARIQGGEEESGTMERLVVTGPKGSGKSVFMAQAMAIALQRNWVVINIPKGRQCQILPPAPHLIHDTPPLQPRTL